MKIAPGISSIADYLSLGYLYLLLLGVASDSIYYGLLGINIISYSSVLDVLLSPITHLTSNLKFPVVVIVIPAVMFAWLKLSFWFYNRRRAPDQRVKELNMLGKMVSLQRAWLILSAWVVFGMFIGFGLGGGRTLQNKLAAGDMDADRRIIFQDNLSEEVKWIGNNSTYAFYVRAGEKTVTVSPIQNNLRAITKITVEPKPVPAPAAEPETPGP